MSYIAERRQEERERRRADILDAAEAVGLEHGWDALTMEQVARRARLSRALLYVYFKDKSDLMFGLSERGIAVLHARFQEALERGRRGLDQITGMGRAYVAFSQEFPLYFDLMSRCDLVTTDLGAMQPNEAACLTGGDSVQRLMIEALAHGVSDGSIRADVGEPAEVATVLKGFIHGVIQLSVTKARLLSANGVEVRHMLEQAIVMASRALASPG